MEINDQCCCIEELTRCIEYNYTWELICIVIDLVSRDGKMNLSGIKMERSIWYLKNWINYKSIITINNCLYRLIFFLNGYDTISYEWLWWKSPRRSVKASLELICIQMQTMTSAKRGNVREHALHGNAIFFFFLTNVRKCNPKTILLMHC